VGGSLRTWGQFGRKYNLAPLFCTGCFHASKSTVFWGRKSNDFSWNKFPRTWSRYIWSSVNFWKTCFSWVDLQIPTAIFSQPMFLFWTALFEKDTWKASLHIKYRDYHSLLELLGNFLWGNVLPKSIDFGSTFPQKNSPATSVTDSPPKEVEKKNTQNTQISLNKQKLGEP